MAISHDAIADDQPKSGPFSNAFGGKEWLKNVVANVRRDARAVIMDFHEQMVILAARALGGRSTARSLLVQVVLAQAVFVVARDWFLRDLPADCLDYFREVVHVERVLMHVPDIQATTVVVSAIRALAAIGIVIALTRPRSLAYYTAIERVREEAG